MRKLDRRTFVGSALAVAATAVSHPPDGFANEPYPTRAITIVNPFAPGSVSDFAARLVGQSLQEQFGHPVIIENKVGGGGLLAGTFVQRAKPDGYTLMLTASSSFSGAALFKKPHAVRPGERFHPHRADRQLPLVRGERRPAAGTTIQEFAPMPKANLGKRATATAHHGPDVGEILKLRTGINVVRVPYRSSPAGVTDLIAGQVQRWCRHLGTGLATPRADGFARLRRSAGRGTRPCRMFRP